MLKALVLVRLGQFVVILIEVLVFFFMVRIFTTIASEFQWLAAPAFPIVRELIVQLMALLDRFTCKSDNEVCVLRPLNVMLNTFYILYLSLVLGSVATRASCCVLLVVDTLMNFRLTARVIRSQHGSSEEMLNDSGLHLVALIENETLEFEVPLMFLLCVGVLHAHPNGAVMLGIRNSLWGYAGIERFEWFLPNVLVFVGIDIVCLITSAVLLYWKCGVKLWKVYILMHRHYGWARVGAVTMALFGSFCMINVGCGADTSLQFEWAQRSAP